MSATPFAFSEIEFPASWPLTAAGSGPVGASVRHLMDLGHFFRDGTRGWSDALTSETRRHLAGCLATIESALVLHVGESALGSLLTLIDRPVIWPAIQRYPHILSPELMAHMRLRAAVSLLGTQAMRGDGDHTADAVQGTGWLIDDKDEAVVEAAVALMLAEARWSAPGGASMFGTAIRADLPAEHFGELVWASAVVLGTELHRAGLVEQNTAMAALTDAAFALLAQHDEEAGGFAVAIRLARLLADRGRHAELLGQTLSERRYLLFAGLVGELIDVELEAVLDILVQGSDTQLAALCKTLGGTASDYRHLLLDLAIVRGQRDDPTLVRLAHNYDDLQADDVSAQTEALRRPAALRAKLAMIPSGNRA